MSRRKIVLGIGIMFSKTLVRNAMLFIEPSLGLNDTQGYLGMPRSRFIGNGNVTLTTRMLKLLLYRVSYSEPDRQ